MPRAHSLHFNEVKKKATSLESNEAIHLDALILRKKLEEGSLDYEAMADLLRETNDAQFGIVSTLQGGTWLRDATAATPLSRRTLRKDAPVIEGNNALLRCLSRLRPIDYAIEKKMGLESESLRKDLKDKLIVLTGEILAIVESATSEKEKHDAIKEKEREFNTYLVQQLHKAGLTRECESKQDAERLLAHYRTLSSVLSPARTMVTLTYDPIGKVVQRETQYPVTKKTPRQKEELAKLNVVTPSHERVEKSAHSTHSLAQQEADSLFVDLLVSDETTLSAQARKTHLVGVKNAFIVKNELMPIVDEAVLDNPTLLDAMTAEPINTLWLARMGSPVFIGRGEKYDTIVEHTKENLEQVRHAAKEHMKLESLHLHVITLNTDSFLQQQERIVRAMYQVLRTPDTNDHLSYMPTNVDGTFRLLDIAPEFSRRSILSKGTPPLQKATRLESVSRVLLDSAVTEDTLSVVHCASGQDRTGTAVEKVIQDWMKKRYGERDSTNIETMRAEGGNVAEITSHYVHGSPGMKAESIADNFWNEQRTFNARVTEELYLASASTNKKNKVGTVDFLKEVGSEAVIHYEQALKAFDEQLQQIKNKLLLEQGKKLRKQIVAIRGDELTPLSAREMEQLTHVLIGANKCLAELHKPDDTKRNIKALANLAKEISGNSSTLWKTLGYSLLSFACAALVVVGVLAAISTGGASLLASVIGAIGVSATVGIGAGVLATGAVGAAALQKPKEKGLIEALGMFKNAIKDHNEIKDIHNDEDKGDNDSPTDIHYN